MESEIKIQGISTPFICAYQLETTHSYKPRPWAIETTYFYDGVYLYSQKTGEPMTGPIDRSVLAKHCHYGPYDGGPRKYDNQSVLTIVEQYYYEHFKQCSKARENGLPIPQMVQPLEFFISYCGN
jgi:hypothetical protein